jgi:hypothetical protein
MLVSLYLAASEYATACFCAMHCPALLLHCHCSPTFPLTQQRLPLETHHCRVPSSILCALLKSQLLQSKHSR